MINNNPELISLEDYDRYTHRRSKSSGYNINPPQQKYYLLEKKDSQVHNCPSINTLSDTYSNQYLNVREHTSKFREVDITHNSQDHYDKRKKYENSDTQTIYEDSFNLSIHSYGKVGGAINNNIVDYEKYKTLKEKYLKQKTKYISTKEGEKNWRSSYFNLLKDSLGYDETIKTLMEENRIHQEYIISLENKINKILTSCNSITSNFHSSLYKNMNNNFNNVNSTNNISFSCNENMNTGNPNINNFSNLLAKNYNEVLNDYKRQLEILADEKENLNTNLSISRHQQLQTSIKLEALQTRLYNLEQARLEDLKVLENLTKEYNYHNIK